MATIIFSHGFGVRADARGMFTDIASAFPEHACVMFDYNTVHANGDIEVTSLQDQARRLQQAIDEQTGEVVIIAHSQGCVAAGLVNPEKIRKVLLLAPPVLMSANRVLQKLSSRAGATISLTEMSRLPRSDGTYTLIPKEYIESVKNVDPMSIYTHLAGAVETVIVRCMNDEVLGLTNVNEVPGAKHVDIDADHNFTGPARTRLIAVLASEL